MFCFQTGSYLLGFRIDPRERLNKVAKQLGSLHSIYWKNPVLGITTGQTKDETIQNVCKYGMNIYIYIYIERGSDIFKGVKYV